MAKQKPMECFVLMPISDPKGYDGGHFQRVYQDLLRPACQAAKFEARRADEVTASNLIQLDILHRLLRSPMALCDLSSLNPNVMFELGIRQAFDMPVVLIKDDDTPNVFDIAPLRTITYRHTIKCRRISVGLRML
jgi:hypothetical protein